MIVTFIGAKKISFDGSNGDQIKGTTLYFSYPEEGVTGQKAEKTFIRDGIEVPPSKLGEKLDISFDMRGKAISVSKATN